MLITAVEPRRKAMCALYIDGCVFFTCDGEKPKAGDFVKVRVTDYTGCDPVGEFVGKID